MDIIIKILEVAAYIFFGFLIIKPIGEYLENDKPGHAAAYVFYLLVLFIIVYVLKNA